MLHTYIYIFCFTQTGEGYSTVFTPGRMTAWDAFLLAVVVKEWFLTSDTAGIVAALTREQGTECFSCLSHPCRPL